MVFIDLATAIVGDRYLLTRCTQDAISIFELLFYQLISSPNFVT